MVPFRLTTGSLDVINTRNLNIFDKTRKGHRYRPCLLKYNKYITITQKLSFNALHSSVQKKKCLSSARIIFYSELTNINFMRLIYDDIEQIIVLTHHHKYLWRIYKHIFCQNTHAYRGHLPDVYRLGFPESNNNNINSLRTVKDKLSSAYRAVGINSVSSLLASVRCGSRDSALMSLNCFHNRAARCVRGNRYIQYCGLPHPRQFWRLLRINTRARTMQYDGEYKSLFVRKQHSVKQLLGDVTTTATGK